MLQKLERIAGIVSSLINKRVEDISNDIPSQILSVVTDSTITYGGVPMCTFVGLLLAKLKQESVINITCYNGVIFKLEGGAKYQRIYEVIGRVRKYGNGPSLIVQV